MSPIGPQMGRRSCSSGSPMVILAVTSIVINVDGTGRTRLTDTPKRWEWSPTFSPNGQRIAFGRGQGPRAPDQADIFSVAMDGTDKQRLTDTNRLDEFWYTWQAA